jgi:hypothetical protein
MKKKGIRMLITMVSPGLNNPLHQSLQRIFSGQILYEEPGVCVLRAAPGILIQLCGPGAQVPACLASPAQPLISYAVNNLEQVIDIAHKHGAVILQQATDCCSGFSTCYIQFPDEQIVGFFTNG